MVSVIRAIIYCKKNIGIETYVMGERILVGNRYHYQMKFDENTWNEWSIQYEKIPKWLRWII